MKILTGRVLFLVLWLACTACYQSAKYDTPDPELLYLEHTDTPAAGVADGGTPTDVKAKLSDDASLNRRTVVFHTTLGSFVGGKGDSIRVEAIKTTEGLFATAQLISVYEGPATISAKAYGGVVAANKAKVIFQRAYPTTIRVSVDSFAVSNRITSELVLTSTLGRSNGRKPSVGTFVNFDVRYPSNPAGATATAGSFVNNISQARSDASGVARIRYSPGGVNYEGYLTIIATTADSTGANLSAQTRVFLYKK